MKCSIERSFRFFSHFSGRIMAGQQRESLKKRRIKRQFKDAMEASQFEVAFKKRLLTLIALEESYI